MVVWINQYFHYIANSYLFKIIKWFKVLPPGVNEERMFIMLVPSVILVFSFAKQTQSK